MIVFIDADPRVGWSGRKGAYFGNQSCGIVFIAYLVLCVGHELSDAVVGVVAGGTAALGF